MELSLKRELLVFNLFIMETTGQGKTTAVVAYITIIGTIIAYFMNLEPKDRLASFHIRQAFGCIFFYT